MKPTETRDQAVEFPAPLCFESQDTRVILCSALAKAFCLGSMAMLINNPLAKQNHALFQCFHFQGAALTVLLDQGLLSRPLFHSFLLEYFQLLVLGGNTIGKDTDGSFCPFI